MELVGKLIDKTISMATTSASTFKKDLKGYGHPIGGKYMSLSRNTHPAGPPRQTLPVNDIDMSFFWWGSNIRLDDSGRFLIADLILDTMEFNEDKGYRTNWIDLNVYLHNNNGTFEWNWLQMGFHASAKDISLEIRGENDDCFGYDKMFNDDLGIWITAKLQNTAGEWKEAEFCLDANIKNWEGYFEVLLLCTS